MNVIHPIDYDKYISKHVFKYQFFQTYRIFVVEPLDLDDAVDYYETENEAKQRQAYEMHRMMSGTYKANNRIEGQKSHFFKRFVDERDVEFFVDAVSNHQMTEIEYYKYIRMVEKTYPEKLI